MDGSMSTPSVVTNTTMGTTNDIKEQGITALPRNILAGITDNLDANNTISLRQPCKSLRGASMSSIPSVVTNTTKGTNNDINRHQEQGITALPRGILAGITANLDANDTISLRQTCKSLRDPILTRHLTLSPTQNYINERIVGDRNEENDWLLTWEDQISATDGDFLDFLDQISNQKEGDETTLLPIGGLNGLDQIRAADDDFLHQILNQNEADDTSPLPMGGLDGGRSNKRS